MKSLKQFITEKNSILEAFDTYRCKNLKVVFNLLYNNSNIISFQIPETYSEDNFQIYIQDLYLNDLPGNSFKTKDTLKNNVSNLFDTNFEYESYEKTEEEPKEYIEWKTDYDEHVSEDDKLVYVNLDTFKYIMSFDSFDLNSETEESVREDLNTIFKSMSIVDDENLPFDVIYNDEELDYE